MGLGCAQTDKRHLHASPPSLQHVIVIPTRISLFPPYNSLDAPEETVDVISDILIVVLPAATSVSAMTPSKWSGVSTVPSLRSPNLRFSCTKRGQFSALAPRSVWHHLSLQKMQRACKHALFLVVKSNQQQNGPRTLYHTQAARRGAKRCIGNETHLFTLHAGKPCACAKRSQGGAVGRW